jgi:hypothetical protein
VPKATFSMQLDEQQRRAFYRDGYLHLPGVVPHAQVERALAAIDASVERGLEPARMDEFYARSFCPELRSSPEILELFEATPARALANLLVAPGGVRSPRLAQIALRFPSAPVATRTLGAGAPDPTLALRPHVDGSYSPSNGVQAGQVAHFTMLAMVALSDVDTDFAGNFTVWPGSHHRYEQYFKDHDVRDMVRGTPRLEGLPAPHQTRVKAGDLVLAHYQLGHTGAPNLSVFVRYAVFFRLYHQDHDADAIDILADIWREYPDLRRFA